MTRAQLSLILKANETETGGPSSVALTPRTSAVIESVYIHGTGPHRAWKRLYYLVIDGKKLGGYDRRDSFAIWAFPKIV